MTIRDDGGNAVKLRTPANLHTYWDDVLGTGKAVSMALTAAAQLAAVPAGAASDLNVQHWIDESVSAAQSTAYRKPPTGDGHGPFTLTSPYKTCAKALARQCVALKARRSPSTTVARDDGQERRSVALPLRFPVVLVKHAPSSREEGGCVW